MTYRFKVRVDAKGKSFLYLKVSHKGIARQRDIYECESRYFNAAAEMITEKHPEFDFLAPMIMDLKMRARRLKATKPTNPDAFLAAIFEKEVSDILFYDFANGLVAEMKKLSDDYGKHNPKLQNKMLGNIKVYDNVLNRFRPFGEDALLVQLDYELLNRFKRYLLGIGNAPATVHLYLRTLRSIYNKAVLRYKLFDEKPFAGVFSGLTVKSYASRKKHIDADAIRLLETATVASSQQKYVDMWLLGFYFGGCDLIDLYYMKKNNVIKERVFFERSKTNTGQPIDLKIHPKAAAILKKYECPGEWLFPWDKKKDIYESFRSRYAKVLKMVQQDCGIEVMPTGGNLSVKVARHSFATIGKRLGIEEDILRELMGHERNDVDNYYKDRYPMKVRDEALWKIIDF